MARLSLGPLIKPGSIHDNLTVWSQFHVRAVHRARCRSLKVDTFAVVTAPVARTLKLIFAGLPIGRAAQMSAAGIDYEHTIRRAVHPDAVFLLPFGVHAQGIVRGIADLEYGGRLEERTGKEKTKEGDEPSSEESSDGNPHQPSPVRVEYTRLGTNGSQSRGGRCF